MKKVLQILLFFLFVTQICFAQWYEQTSGTKVSLTSVHFENANNGWTVGENGTIIHTTNGGQEWRTQTSGTSKHLNGVWFSDLNTGWIVGDSGKIFKTSNGGQEWIEQTSGTRIDLNSVCFVDLKRGWVVGSVDSGIILGTTNGGINWISQSYDTLQPSLNSVCFVDSITGWVFGLHALLRTTDGGHNWFGVGVYGDGLFTGHFLDQYTGWVSIYGAGVVHGFILYTTNGGIDWSFGEGPPTASSIYFVDANNGWAVGHQSMGNESNTYNSIDGGRNWIAQTQITLGTLNSVYFTDINNGWAVGEGGAILHTTNGGNPVPVELTSFTATANGKEVTLNWSTATELNNQGFEVQRKFCSNEFVTVGSVKGHGTTTSPNNYTYVDKLTDAGKYFYRLKQIDFGGRYEYSQTVEINWSPFTSYELNQNFPNPLNPSTTIGFVIMEKGNVRLSVLNILGEEIKVLLNEEKEAGYHSIDFNGIDLPSSVYFYRIQAGNFIDTKKMILLK